MKKHFTQATIIFALIALVSCKDGADKKVDSKGNETTKTSKEEAKGGATAVDYKSLQTPGYVTTLYADLLSKIGNNITKLDEIDIDLNRPSKDAMIKRDKPDYLAATVSYLDPKDPNKLFQQRYSTETGWDEGSSREVQLIGGNVETFKLSDDMFDATPVTADVLNKVIADAFAKYKDEAKYKDQYVYSVDIKKGEIEVAVKGQLAANDQYKSEYYKADLKGNKK